ncbi:MAG: S-methyl-5'-thioadenosine phosphorylase [Candidatus Omnitrophica bacterium]|nr:S-methyl-5'-thioadenosine phosphorylase [Candidatus Omnitrophota bacterium]
MSRIGIIGGSGLYDIEGLRVIKKEKVKTPFGDPSDEFTLGQYEDKEIIFLPRHDRAHKIMPSELNYRANIFGMKKLGVERIISLSACGSFKEELKPRDIVIVDQFVDRTNQARVSTFFGDGIVAHVAFGEPVCPELSLVLYDAAKKTGADVHKGGTYVNMEGPAFSTKAESLLYKSWGMDVIGMTNMPEARLSREAEICYSTVCFITDYDAWRQTGEVVTLEMIIGNLKKNVDNAKKLIKAAISMMGDERKCACKDALKGAIITRPEVISSDVKKRLKMIIGKYVK